MPDVLGLHRQLTVGAGAALAAAVASAFCYGVGTVLEGVGARRVEATKGLDVRLFARLAGQLPYVLGLVVDLLGWALSLVALRALPLFAVQATVASSIAVTAVLSWGFLRVPFRRSDGWAVLVVVAGLALVGLSAAPESSEHLARPGRALLLLGAFALTIVGAYAARLAPSDRTAVVLGALAGVAWGGAAIAARVIVVPHNLVALGVHPLAWAIVLYGALGMLLLATALQRGSVTAATAALFVAETVVPGIVGIAFLDDRARPGLLPAASLGFVLAVGGSIALARSSSVPKGS